MATTLAAGMFLGSRVSTWYYYNSRYLVYIRALSWMSWGRNDERVPCLHAEISNTVQKYPTTRYTGLRWWSWRGELLRTRLIPTLNNRHVHRSRAREKGFIRHAKDTNHALRTLAFMDTHALIMDTQSSTNWVPRNNTQYATHGHACNANHEARTCESRDHTCTKRRHLPVH